MKTVNRIRIAMTAAAALGLATLSSSASAQPTMAYCDSVAWYNCSWVNGQPTFVTLECYTAEYEACMAGALAANTPPSGALYREVAPASGPAAAPKL